MMFFQYSQFSRNALFLLSFFSVMGSVTFATADSCESEFEVELEKLNIPIDRIKDSYTLDIFENAGSRIARVQGWVSFKDCKGSLVMNFDKSCLFERSYTTNKCNVPGIN
jgi:hypothetical protein